MCTMSTFCRITGHARNLPKPCYFPLLPPLSPADAKKLCRVTGRATDSHNYSPLIAFGKPYHFDGLEGCRITQNESLSFTRPTFIKTKDNEKSLESLTNVLDKMKNKKKKKVDAKKMFVYRINGYPSGIVFPPEVEEAIITGEIESMSISKDGGHMTVKIKEGRVVKVPMEPIPTPEVKADDYYYGEGQSKEVLEKQQQVLNERNKRKQDTMARKKLFEDKEKKAEEDEKQATERPKSKRPPVKFDPLKRKAKLEKMFKMIEEQKNNSGIILPKLDTVSKVNVDEQIMYEKMLEDITKAQRTSINVTTVFSSNFDWAEIEKSDNASFDWSSFPHQDICEPIEITVVDIQTDELSNIPNAHKFDIAASVETIEPAPMIDQNVLNVIKNIKEDKLKTTENVEIFKEMNCNKLIPSINDIQKVVSETDSLVHGYLVKDTDGKECKFVEKEKYIPGEGTILSGAMVTIDNEQKFVVGQIIYLAKQESFVAGQTVETSHGKRFLPGQTIVNANGEISFIPGHCVSTEEESKFVAGQVIDKEDGSQFIAGQMVDRGNDKPVFMPGQTIFTETGPKFVPGEINIDANGYREFVPGMTMPSSKGEMFIPGQAFQSEEGLSFTPGRIIDTEEGPSFVTGKSMQTSEGNKRFVKGDMIQTEDGKMTFEISKVQFQIPTIEENLVESDEELIIPNDDLQLLAVASKDITGFLVKPTNTSNIQAGEQLYGDIVETNSSVLFYLTGKLPKDIPPEDKVISGELIVGETCQKFVPGKMLNTMDGEKFIPGQMVKTSDGEEFVPGQIVETADGTKFIPGQMVMTSEGQKFIPGQVLVGEDGPKFVPGQIIQTKNGATFIPGQMMSTNEGQKFVPGQLVDTKDGPRFVPGQVIESNDGPKFISGTVVETEEGLKYLPNSSNTGNAEESEEESEISFQGFDISPEEIQLLSYNITNARPHSPITKQDGLIDSSTLKKLAADTMVIHGRTPEPNIAKKKKKKKKGKITIDALDEDEKQAYEDIEDAGTHKVEILKHLIKAGSTVSSLRKEKELRKLSELLNIEEDTNESEAELEAIKYINSNTFYEDLFESYIGNDDQLISEILSLIGNPENLVRNDQVTNIVNDAVKKAITRRCDQQIDELINKITKNPESLFTDSKAQILLTEAVGIVCVTGDVEVASLLEKFISEPTNPNCLKDDEDVLAVLRQLLVLHRIAEINFEVSDILQELQEDPEGVKDRNKVRRLIREAKSLLVKEKESTGKPFDVRHVASSKDIPAEIFEQIRQDKKEAENFMNTLPDELFKAIMGDERCGGKLIKLLDSGSTDKSSKEIEKFKKGMAVVVAKDNMQAVIPIHFARSIYYGIMPYILIDEEGIKFFERGLTGRKLAPSRIIENTWFQPDSYYEKSVLSKRVTPSGMQYHLVLLGDSYRKNAPSLQYTSLLPSSGPTRISYLETQQRRASRDGSVTPHRRASRSTTPSRRFSTASLHDHYPSVSESFSRKNSIALNPYSLTRGLSPVSSAAELPSVNNYSVVPYMFDEEFESDPVPIARSGTVGKLLDKYSSTSLAKEFGYKKPTGSYSRYNTSNSYVDEEDLDDEGYSAEDLLYLPPSSKHRISTVTPENPEDSYNRYSQDRFKDTLLDETPIRGKRSYYKPFSDIYEIDEPESSNCEMTRKSLIEAAKKSYDVLDSNYKIPSKPVESKLSYSDRLKEWKNKQNISSADDLESQTPTKISHNRYESVLTGEDDYLPSETTYKTPSYLRKMPDDDINNDDEDEDFLLEKHRTKKPSVYVGKYEDDDFSEDKYRNSLRQKYNLGIEELNKNLNISYKDPTYISRYSRFGKSERNNVEDLDPLASKKAKQYNGSRSDSVGYKRYGALEKEPPGIGSKKETSELQNDLHTTAPSGYGSSYGYGGGYSGDYGQPTGYGQPNLYGRPMGYGQPAGYGQPTGYGQPSGYGHPSGYGAPHMYGYQPSQYGSYGGPPMYGGAGMNTYSQRAPYTTPTQRYGTDARGYESPLNKHGLGTSSYSRPGGSSPLAGRKGIPYGGTSRRFTTALNIDDDNDDDDNISSYDPKKGQRSLASKLARKYIGDSVDEDD